MDTILIVDDKQVNREILKNILVDHYEVVLAESGQQALDIISEKRNEITLVLLDIIMPGLDGFDVLRTIRNKMNIQDLPIIVVTESKEEVFEINALKLGATDFVTKPYKPEKIRTRIASILTIKRMLTHEAEIEADEITGLMNTNQFYLRGEAWMKEEKEKKFDVVAVDIDRFSTINDYVGFTGANEILRAMAERIHSAMGKVKFLCSRVYADRFIFLFQRREGYLERLLGQADKLTEDYADQYKLTFKIGVYEMNDSSVTMMKACGRAFSAISVIKDQFGTHYAYYTATLHDQILLEEKINKEMSQALAENQFEVFLQPKYDIFNYAIAGAEALVRWRHPKDGMIVPGIFIPLFEKNNFVTELDKYIWDKTAEIIAKWYKEGKKIVPVSVNVSRRDIENIDVVECLCDIVKKHDLEPELLHLEITESAYVEDSEKIITVAKKLKEHGFLIEMDDFGSGYSSLNMLAKLPIDILKLDMKFIQSIEETVNAKTIIEYTIGLAKWMNIPMVAEGVETEEQLALLKKYECNYVQGFIFAKPMPVPDFEVLLDNSSINGKETELVSKELFVYDSGKKNTMLIVDDLQLNRSIIRGYFNDSFSIVETTNGKAALEYLENGGNADIILLDIYMPKMNGYEVLKALKSSKKYKQIPVMVVSSKTSNNEPKKVYELGADIFLAKPFTAETIIEKVRVLMRAYNIYEDMTVWDIKEAVYNPVIRDLYSTIYIIHEESNKICEFHGEKLVETKKKCDECIEATLFQAAIKKIKKNGNRMSYYLDKEHLVDIRKVEVEKTGYIIYFEKTMPGK